MLGFLQIRAIARLPGVFEKSYFGQLSPFSIFADYTPAA